MSELADIMFISVMFGCVDISTLILLAWLVKTLFFDERR